MDPSQFVKINVADTCSIWNLLSSRLLYARACVANCYFSCTYYVLYECFYKPRQKDPSLEELELQNRLRNERENGIIRECHLNIQDLQEVELLKKRKNLSIGEIASIAFAKKINQAFLTDDDKAMKLAAQVLDKQMVQTTPHLLGWLFFENYLGDGDLEKIIKEHEQHGRSISKRFREAYTIALDFRMKANMGNSKH